MPVGEVWQPVTLPGKKPTQYIWTYKDGRAAIGASADDSASMWRRKVAVPPERLGEVEFSWWVTNLIDGSHLTEMDGEDAPARVVFAFDGDSSRKPLIYEMSKKFEVIFNVRNASVTPTIGIIALEMEGDREEIKKAVAWFEANGVQVEPVEINTIEG